MTENTTPDLAHLVDVTDAEVETAALAGVTREELTAEKVARLKRDAYAAKVSPEYLAKFLRSYPTSSAEALVAAASESKMSPEALAGLGTHTAANRGRTSLTEWAAATGRDSRGRFVTGKS